MAPAVEYRRLGKSGLRVSVPIVGAMSFGSSKWGAWVLDEEDALKLLKAAWDRGVNTIDTANMYSEGVSESIIGKFIKKYNIPREKLIVLTKCFHLCTGDPTQRGWGNDHLIDTKEFVNQAGLSRAAIFNQVNDSLARLDTPYIDLLQIHRHDAKTPREETMKALHDLVEQGKVRYIGASSMRAWEFSEYNHIAETHGWTKFISMQNEYSLLYREDEREMIPYCNAHGIGIIPWGPLNAGDLAKMPTDESIRKQNRPKITSAADLAVITRVNELATKKGWKMSQVALAWINTKVSSPIVGMSSPERLEEAIIPDKKLTEEEIKYLEEPYVPKVVRGHP